MFVLTVCAALTAWGANATPAPGNSTVLRLPPLLRTATALSIARPPVPRIPDALRSPDAFVPSDRPVYAQRRRAVIEWSPATPPYAETIRR